MYFIEFKNISLRKPAQKCEYEIMGKGLIYIFYQVYTYFQGELRSSVIYSNLQLEKPTIFFFFDTLLP